MLQIPNISIPDLSSQLFFPVPGLFTVALGVAAIGFFSLSLMVFWQIGRPESGREHIRYGIQATPYISMFALDYATDDVLGVVLWAGLYLFDAVRFRFGLSMREILTEIALWFRRRLGNLNFRN
jgi:hypothetical protein